MDSAAYPVTVKRKLPPPVDSVSPPDDSSKSPGTDISQRSLGRQSGCAGRKIVHSVRMWCQEHSTVS